MSTGHEIAMSLRLAYLAMHRQSEASLSGKDGVTADQFVVLSVLAEEDGITQQALGRRTSSDPNTIGAMLRLMARRGLVVRRAHPTDGRARCVMLTAKGRTTFTRLWSRSQGVRDRLQGLFRPDEARMVTELLGRITGRAAAITKQPKRPCAGQRVRGRLNGAPDREVRSIGEYG